MPEINFDYNKLYADYLDVSNEKVFFEKRRKIAYLIFKIKTAHQEGLIENISELPNWSKVFEYDEGDVGFLERLLSENYFPDLPEQESL